MKECDDNTRKILIKKYSTNIGSLFYLTALCCHFLLPCLLC